MKIFQLLLLIFLLAFQISRTQEKGETIPEMNPDSVFIFESPRNLITTDPTMQFFRNVWGINLIFSGSGFGGGTFYQYAVSKYSHLFASLYISGARNSDELEYIDQFGNIFIPGKINRLFMFPLIFGYRQQIFTESLNETFRPYIEGGLGPTFIIATPFEREFFNAFGHAATYTRFGATIGLGANFSSKSTALMGFDIRYYYIPFGGEGLESIRGLPIMDFGGLFLSLSLGVRF